MIRNQTCSCQTRLPTVLTARPARHGSSCCILCVQHWQVVTGQSVVIMSPGPIKAAWNHCITTCNCFVMLWSSAGLLHCHSIQAAAVAAMQASCSFPGFTFKSGFLPTITLPRGHHNLADNPVHLLSLPYKPVAHEENSLPPKPFANMSATAAACTADAACGMFTSGGYIIGAYRISDEAGSTKKTAKEADIITWKPISYCTWSCCGTWVADGLIAHLLQPVPVTSAQSKGIEKLNAKELPQDTELQYTLKPNLLHTVCAGKAGTQENNRWGMNATRGFSCPSHCPVACCKQLANTSDPDRNFMGQFHFSQCSGTVCSGCGYIGNTAYPSNVANILLRRYVREAALHSAGGLPANRSGCKPGGSPSANRGVPSLC